MKVNMAHLRQPADAGGYVDFAVFDARSSSGTNADNAKLLAQLTTNARAAGLKVDQSALAFSKNGRLTFQGSKPLVEFLSKGWVPRWTHKIDA